MKQSIVLSSGVLFLSLAFAFLSAPTVGRAQEPSPSVEVPDGLSAGDWSSIRQAYEANRYAAYRVAGGQQAPLTIDPIAQQAYLKASNTDDEDWFGTSVAVSGDTVVVGASFESSNATGVNGDQSDNSAYQAGAAYVFRRSGATWSQEAYLKASNTDSEDSFGSSVAVSGDTVVVGATGEGSNATGVNGDQSNNGALGSGAAYVFVRSGTTWSQEAYLKASNTDANDLFGSSLAVSGDTVVVGASDESSNATGVNGDQIDNSASEAGAAYVFLRSGTVWTQEAYLKASNTDLGDQFGASVVVSGDTVAVGAFTEASNATGVNGDQSNNSADSAGATYVFVRTGTTWSQEAYLKASNTGVGDSFGRTVAVCGDTIAIGAPAEASNATGVNGDQGNNSASAAGAAYVFVRSGTLWSQEAYLKASNTGVQDYFGISVAVSGDKVVVGAPAEASNATGVNGDQSDNSATGAGAAYMFVRSGTTWSQEAYLKASNTDSNDVFGYSVAVSSDKVVVGALGEESNATGVNGDQNDNSASEAGAAYVLEIPIATATFRSAGSNPASYAASPPVLGSTWTATVDLTTTGHSLAQVLGYTSPATLTLSGGQVLLVGGTKIFALPLQAGPLASWSDTIPLSSSLVGLHVYTQAAHIVGAPSFALSNAQDLVVGY